MRLELHDSEVGNTLTAGIKNIDYDYQAEQWVLDTYQDPQAKGVVRWVLIDDLGERCVWECKQDDPGCPRIAKRSERFAGEWTDGDGDTPQTILPGDAGIAGKASCGCVYHAEDGIPCEHDRALAANQ